MGAITSLIAGRASIFAFLILALVLACAGLGLWVYIDHLKIGKDVAQLDEVRLDLKQATIANSSAQSAITSLQTSLEKWQSTAQAQAKAAQQAADATAQDKARIDQLTAQVAAKEAQDNALPSCSKLIATNVAAVCPGHADALRMRATAAIGVPGPSHP